MRLCGACRNDANDFFILLLVDRMYDKQNRARLDGADGYPAFLILECVVTPGDGIGIVENELRSLEANIVLAKVLPILAIIPFKSHSQSL